MMVLRQGKESEVKVGVHRGSVLSPLIFRSCTGCGYRDGEGWPADGDVIC